MQSYRAPEGEIVAPNRGQATEVITLRLTEPLTRLNRYVCNGEDPGVAVPVTDYGGLGRTGPIPAHSVYITTCVTSSRHHGRWPRMRPFHGAVQADLKAAGAGDTIAAEDVEAEARTWRAETQHKRGLGSGRPKGRATLTAKGRPD